MTALHPLTRQTLEADSALLALFTGGVWDADEVFREGVAPNVPRVADGITLKPFITLRWGTAAAIQGDVPSLSAERESLDIFFYQDVGYDIIEQGITLVKGRLHNQYISASDRALTHGTYVHSSGELAAEELNYAPCRFSRYQFITRR